MGSIDWSAALFATAAYDVAFTRLIQAEPPVAVPRPLRPFGPNRGVDSWRVGSAADRRLSGTEIDDCSLRWHEGAVCLRALVEVAG